MAVCHLNTHTQKNQTQHSWEVNLGRILPVWLRPQMILSGDTIFCTQAVVMTDISPRQNDCSHGYMGQLNYLVYFPFPIPEVILKKKTTTSSTYHSIEQLISTLERSAQFFFQLVILLLILGDLQERWTPRGSTEIQTTVSNNVCVCVHVCACVHMRLIALTVKGNWWFLNIAHQKTALQYTDCAHREALVTVTYCFITVLKLFGSEGMRQPMG